MTNPVQSGGLGASADADPHRVSETPVLDLIRRLEAGERGNALDLAVELATFEPCKTYSGARLNSAKTKVIYTRNDGGEETCLAPDWTLEPWRSEALTILIAKATGETQ